MSRFTNTVSLSFEAATRLSKYRGKKSHVHGHTYFVDVSYSAGHLSPSKKTPPGMICDSTVVKRFVKELIVDVFDHSMILASDDPLASYLLDFKEKHLNVRVIPRSYYDPTAECLAHWFLQMLKDSELEKEYNIEIVSVTVHEGHRTKSMCEA